MRERADFLIIGSGVAGLRAAATLAHYGSVLILTKSDPTESNTGYAQGGIAAAVGADDSPEEHFADTIAAGDGLCHEDAVRVLVDDGVAYVRELVDWGAAFDRTPGGELALGREAAHRVRRVLHARDATGREIGRLLWSRVSAEPRVRVCNHARASKLIVRGGVCVGARYLESDAAGECEAGAVLLATGGAGQVYSDTTNPAIATGDGIALGYLAGARVADLEFVQFHPTALAASGAPRFLLSEALRGEGAWLVNDEGERFMTRYERAGELASRDLVSRAIVHEAARTGRPIYLSMQHLDPDWIHQRFPTIAAACAAAGFDLARDLIPVGPAAHYIMGGVETDVCGRTTVAGLFAAGEVACTGVHGANRLASNSLLEGLVFGARAAEAMLSAGATSHEGAKTHDGATSSAEDAEGAEERSSTTEAPRHLSTLGACPGMDNVRVVAGERIATARSAPPSPEGVQSLMWNAVGLVRDADRLRPAVEQLAQWSAHSDLALVGYLIAKAALRREESRGGHFRADFPSRDDLHWRAHIAEQYGR